MDKHRTQIPDHAIAPIGLNHIVLNVCDIERSHIFWTEILGFEQVGELHSKKNRPTPPNMRFYSGRNNGDINHHDLALVEVPEKVDVDLKPGQPGLNHIAITWPNRKSWLLQLSFMQSRGVEFIRRTNHGVTHSVYIADPDGNGVEVLYELPKELWQENIDASLNYSENLPINGKEALIDREENPTFKRI